MTTTTSSSSEKKLFPGIEALGGPHGSHAASSFESLEHELRRSGAKADIKRLHDVDGDAHRLDFPALEQIAGPEHMVETLTKRDRDRYRRWMGARNAVALVPLLLTWGFLAWAALDYRQLIAIDPSRIDQPFLLLWEQGFGGSDIPSFSTAASTTCLLLVGLLTMTLVAHRRETQAIQHEGRTVALVDGAMNSLRTAVEHGAEAKPPVSAEEWALAAQRILENTQKVLAEAMRQTAELTAANHEITKNAQETLRTISTESAATLTTISAKSERFIEDLADTTTKLLDGIREENSTFINNTAEKAVELLEEATKANRRLIVEQMSPLVNDFRSTLADFTAHHQAYLASATSLAKSAQGLDESAAILAANAKYYTVIAKSIDEHLDNVEKSQEKFTDKITATADGMGATAKAMLDATNVMRNDLKKDLESLAKTAVDAGTKVAAVNVSLVSASNALDNSTSKLDRTTAQLDSTTAEMQKYAKSSNDAAIAMEKAANEMGKVVGTLSSYSPAKKRGWFR